MDPGLVRRGIEGPPNWGPQGPSYMCMCNIIIYIRGPRLPDPSESLTLYSILLQGSLEGAEVNTECVVEQLTNDTQYDILVKVKT